MGVILRFFFVVFLIYHTFSNRTPYHPFPFSICMQRLRLKWQLHLHHDNAPEMENGVGNSFGGRAVGDYAAGQIDCDCWVDWQAAHTLLHTHIDTHAYTYMYIHTYIDWLHATLANKSVALWFALFMPFCSLFPFLLLVKGPFFAPIYFWLPLKLSSFCLLDFGFGIFNTRNLEDDR